VKRTAAVALGIVAAIGGYVDIGELVFNTQAGARFGYQILWAVPVGVLGIIVYAEMAGRVAAIADQASFDLIRDHYPRRVAAVALVASLLLNLLTVAAELGGVGLALNLFFDLTPQAFTLLGVIALAFLSWRVRFEGIERLFGYGGLTLLVYLVAAVHLHPDWSALGDGLVPRAQSSSLYLYFVVGVLAASFMPYQIYFYSSGGIEEGWTEKQLPENRLNAILGFSLGGLLAAALVVVGAEVLQPNGINPDSIGTTALTIEHTFGVTGLAVALVGILFAVGGAAIATSFSGAYNLAQHQGWCWGKNQGLRGAPRWHVTALVFLVGGFAIVAAGINPVMLTEYAVIFSAVVLPLTYFPLLRAARDRELMGDYTNGRLADALGWLYFGVICIVSIAAPILLFVTDAGGG
jgi:Mn2+/Fe2+ NRAMP family transporter